MNNPAIYKFLGTRVSIDLSTLNDLGQIRESVKTLGDQITAAQPLIDAAKTNTDALDTRFGKVVGAGVDRIEKTMETARNGLRDEIVAVKNAQVTRFDTLDSKADSNANTLLAAIAALPHAESLAPITDITAPMIQSILELQIEVLKGKVRPDPTNALNQLQKYESLALQLKRAFAGSSPKSWGSTERSQCYWALHRLIENIAEKAASQQTSAAG
jgi:hypothetical protein